MNTLTQDLVNECKQKLLSKKTELLNRVKDSRKEFHARDNKGDEIDETVALLAEHTFLSTHEKLRAQLLEIEYALARIERDQYGICEETNEPIEPDRLLAIPWTRLSIEGAELREEKREDSAIDNS